MPYTGIVFIAEEGKEGKHRAAVGNNIKFPPLARSVYPNPGRLGLVQPKGGRSSLGYHAGLRFKISRGLCYHHLV